MAAPGAAVIEQFVRGTLGCQCPDEVFRSVVVERLAPAAGRPALVQLLVGSRLLVHVVAVPPAPPADGWLEQLAAHGRALRDRYGYNRYRLVVAAADGEGPPRSLGQRFARAAGGDERMHLHLIGAGQLPDGLDGCASAAGSADTVAK